MNLEKKQRVIGWFFVLLATIMIFIFYFYPILRSFVLSLQTGVGQNMTFTGLSNYKRLFADDLFKTSLQNTFIYIVQVPIMLILALILATLLNDKNLKCRAFFRTAIFLPCATSLVSYSIIFRSMFALDGFVNAFLMKLNLITKPINWLGSDPWRARLIIIIALTWRWTGYNMVFYLSGLQNIEPSIYEAAEIDGAGPLTKFFRITIPLLRPIILLTTIMSVNGTLQLFDETKNLTNGGPANATLSMSQYIYRLSFEYSPQFGYAAAISFVVFIMVAILTFIQMRVGDKR